MRYIFTKGHLEVTQGFKPKTIERGSFLTKDEDGKYKLYDSNGEFTLCRYGQKCIDEWIDEKLIIVDVENKEDKIKYLASYLPYGLEIQFYLDENDNGVWVLDHTNINMFSDNDKPILRSLSDLTKEIEHNGEKFIPLEYLQNNPETYPYMVYDGDVLMSEEEIIASPMSIPFIIAKKLLEWHFDLYGLIDKGEAIDKNTLD